MTEYELCPHGRHVGAVCLECSEQLINDIAERELIEEYVDPYDDPLSWEWVNEEQESGLDAPYYDFPDNIHSAMDLIEYLNLDFSQGNILKSIIRENNPNAQKKTTQLYEAEKQYYYASRRLRSLQGKEAD